MQKNNMKSTLGRLEGEGECHKWIIRKIALKTAAIQCTSIPGVDNKDVIFHIMMLCSNRTS